MIYELWDLESRNLIEFFEHRQEAADAVQAYVDAGDAVQVVLLEHSAGDDSLAHSLTGQQLVQWLQAARDNLQRTA